jgi:thioredoxin reductase (NADPH)
MVDADVVVVGAGPVGLFAVFQCGMARLKCHVVDALEAVGGQCRALYPEKPIYDIPGFPSLPAGELVERLEEQARPFAPVYHLGRRSLTLAQETGGRWLCGLEDGTRIRAGAVIVAAGCGAFGPKRPPLEGIEAYEGRSVHYFVTRRDDFRGRRVVVTGGGDSAVDWAVALTDVARRVMVVHRRPKFRASPDSEARLKALAEAGALDLVVPYQLHRLEGADGILRAVEVATVSGDTRRLEADSLLAFFGMEMDLGPIGGWNLTLEDSRIAVDPASQATSLPGVFAIGDVCVYPGKLKLILTGFAEAARAAHSIRAHLHPGEAMHFEHSTTSGIPGA